MELSLNAENILRFFKERRNQEKREVVEYLEEVAYMAKQLAMIWEDLCKQSLKSALNPFAEIQYQKSVEKLYRTMGFSTNATPYYTLINFYHMLSHAVGGKIEGEWMEQLLERMALIILQRNHVRDNYEKTMSGFHRMVFLDSQNTDEDVKQFTRSVDALRREAAALDVLVKTIKVKYL